MGALEELYETFRADVAFFVVYIREAHPTDGWQVPMNEQDQILFAQPTTIAERADVAQQMCSVLKINIPTLIDGMDDRVNQQYNAWPDRLYLVGVDGKVAYKGGPGPFGFKPEKLRAAIEQVLNRAP